MQKIAILLSLLLLNATFASDRDWRMVKNSPIISYTADFSCKRGDQSDGHVVRSGVLCPRYNYDLFDANDQFQARGITRFFSLGFIYSWGMEIDVYDDTTYLGLIEGKVITKARAKFNIYSGSNRHIASAYLNTETAEFIICSGADESQVIAELQGKAFGDVSSWEMKFKDTDIEIDERLLKIFAAFVADYHSHFLPKPKEIHHHHYNPNPGYF